MSDLSPAEVTGQMWRWFWITGTSVIVVIGVLVFAGWQAGWWFTNQNINREAHAIRNGYSNQQTLREQVTAQIANVADATYQIDGLPAGQEKADLQAQRRAMAAIVCQDADQVTGDPLPADQLKWVRATCSAGSVAPSSPYFATNGK